MLMLMNHPFSRPIVALGRTLYVQTVTIYSAQPDFEIEISNCSCSVMRGLYSSILVPMKEDELNFVTMEIIFYK